MSASGSPSKRPVIADTVVVNYFLAVGEFNLLRRLLGGSVQIPRAVFDPDEDNNVAEEAASELRRGLRLHRRRCEDKGIARELQERSAQALPHFESLPILAAEGGLVVIDLTDDELDMFARLRDRSFVAQFSLVAGLGRGEAAAVAISLNRNYDLATDDQDAIKVVASLLPAVNVLRIRSLLHAAVNRGVLAVQAAREIHRAMLRAGFWDKGEI